MCKQLFTKDHTIDNIISYVKTSNTNTNTVANRYNVIIRIRITTDDLIDSKQLFTDAHYK